MSKNLIVISAPSGAGKTTICRELQKSDSGFKFSISCTTRPMREYEKKGFDYFFLSEEEFNEKVRNGKLVEYEEVHGYLYGTPRSEIRDAIENNTRLLLEVDVKGGIAIQNAYPENTITIFIRPPSGEELKKRLKVRGTDSEARIEKRLERMKLEMEYEKYYDYTIINENIDVAVNEILNILNTSKKE